MDRCHSLLHDDEQAGGTFGVRIFSLWIDYNSIGNVAFQDFPDVAPGVPAAPIEGQLMGVFPEGLG